MSEPFYYTFPAIRGIQAKKEYYILMCPLRLIPRIFLFDEEELRPELRAQRVLNKARIPEMSSYLVKNPTTYIFSALTASVDAEVDFIPATDKPEHYNIGSLKIPMSAKFIINDGQHRRAAIEAALKERPELGEETISIVLFIDLGLQRSQQMFADLNRYAVRTTKSLSILYDYRDPWAIMVKDIVSKVHVFSGLVETEKSTISNRSTKLFTLSGIYHATQELLEEFYADEIDKQKQLAIEFWNEVGANIDEWRMVKEKKISSAELRKDYINAHSIALAALGKAGNSLLSLYREDWKHRLRKLQNINWHRENTDAWEGRCTMGGRISNSRNNFTLMANYIKNQLELPLTEEESTAEKLYLKKAGDL
jgi:DNA sulfur modification protein DndB